jgi:hypothetical protein
MAPLFLTSALYGGVWSVTRPCRFNPLERAPGTHWIGDWHYFFSFDTTAPVWALAYLHETLRFTSVLQNLDSQ